MLTGSIASIGRMPCNPAIGGLAKGQLVREIDALGGVMGELADAAGIQFRILNRSRGPAVWGPRAQCDRALYSRLARERVTTTANLTVLEGMAESLIEESGRVVGATGRECDNHGDGTIGIGLRRGSAGRQRVCGKKRRRKRADKNHFVLPCGAYCSLSVETPIVCQRDVQPFPVVVQDKC